MKSLDFEEGNFSTFQHVNDQYCPGYGATKKAYTEPYDDNGKVDGCAKGCECEVCKIWAGDEIINCPDPHPDHPEKFNPEEDFVIHRRIFFEPIHYGQRYERPLPSSKRSPSELKPAAMKQ